MNLCWPLIVTALIIRSAIFSRFDGLFDLFAASFSTFLKSDNLLIWPEELASKVSEMTPSKASCLKVSIEYSSSKSALWNSSHGLSFMTFKSLKKTDLQLVNKINLWISYWTIVVVQTAGSTKLPNHDASLQGAKKVMFLYKRRNWPTNKCLNEKKTFSFLHNKSFTKWYISLLYLF